LACLIVANVTLKVSGAHPIENSTQLWSNFKPFSYSTRMLANPFYIRNSEPLLTFGLANLI